MGLSSGVYNTGRTARSYFCQVSSVYHASAEVVLCLARQDQAHIHSRCAEPKAEIPPQCSISGRCKARVIIRHTPKTRIACETHVMSRREVYCLPNHWLC
jgi:hypothetical protein